MHSNCVDQMLEMMSDVQSQNNKLKKMKLNFRFFKIFIILIIQVN